MRVVSASLAPPGPPPPPVPRPYHRLQGAPSLAFVLLLEQRAFYARASARAVTQAVFSRNHRRQVGEGQHVSARDRSD